MKKYTDQEFLYRQTPVNYDGIAKFTSIKGNTLGWNQQLLAPTTNGAATSSADGSFRSNRCTFTYDSATHIITITSLENVGTSGFVFGLANGAPLIVGHKYLQMCDVQAPKVFNFVIGTNDNADAKTNLPANTYHRVSTIKEFSSSSNEIRFNFNNSNGWAGTETVYIKNAMLFDLTQMGLDITDPSEFTSLFPLSYYSYNQGSLLSFNGNGIKTGGENLIDFSTLQIGKNWTKSSAVDRAIIEFPVEENKEYTISFDYSSNISNTIIVYRTGWNTGQISNSDIGTAKEYTFTTPLNCKVVCVQFNARVSGFVLSSSDFYGFWNCALTDTFSTKALPVSTYFPTGMKRAGSVYDELTESKAITRIGRVDLGSLDWTYRTTGSTYAPYFYASFTGIKSNGDPNSRKANILCSKYSTAYRGQASFIDKTICADGSPTELTQIQIKDSSYTDATAFKNSLQGVYLYYELKTPTETDINAEIFYRFYQYGTEQILPINGATPTTAPIWCDIEYYNQIESETPYRKFWLVNGNGERWDLTEKELKSFLENPQGLGFQKTIDVTRYGERAYKNTESYNFPQVTGDVLFYDSANSTRYEKYNEFVRFLMEQPITLHYMIPVSYNSLIADTYSLECEVMSLTKTESKTDRILTSNIQMNGLGFYEGDEIEINGTANTLTINNKGDFPVGFEIELRGTYKNPYFTLEQNGELYGEAKFDDNANNFSSVFVNSKDGEQNVVLKQNNSIMSNPLAYQDLSISNGSIYVTFVKLAKGESTLTIGGDSYTISGYTIRYTPIYRSV